MAARDLSIVRTLSDQLAGIQDELATIDEYRFSQEDAIMRLQISNLSKIAEAKKKQLQAAEKAELKSAQALFSKKAAAELKAAKNAAKKNGGKLSKEEQAAIIAKVNAEFELSEKEKEKLKKKAAQAEKKESIRAAQAVHQNEADTIRKAFGKDGGSVVDRFNAIKSNLNLSSGVTALADLADALQKNVEDIVKIRGSVDTRLQGSRRGTGGLFGIGKSY